MGFPRDLQHHIEEMFGITMKKAAEFTGFARFKPKFNNGVAGTTADLTAAEWDAFLLTADVAVISVTGITAGTTQTQAGATALTGTYNHVTTCATAGDGVALPAATAGKTVVVQNSGAAALKIWPATGDTIDGGSANAGVIVGINTRVTFTAIDGTAWKSSRHYSQQQIALVGNNGQQGQVRLYPATSAKGSVAFSAADNAGDTETLETWSSQAGARTYTRPDAGGDANYAFDKAFACLTAAGAALLPSSASEAIITGGTKAIAAGALTAGNVIRFRAAVKVNAINATDTLTVRARIGAVTASLTGTVVASHISGATTAANDVVVLDGYIDARSFSTPNMTFDAMGIGLGLLAGVGGISTPTVATAFTIDSTAAIDLSITIQFSTNSGTNSATLQGFTHEIKAS